MRSVICAVALTLVGCASAPPETEQEATLLGQGTQPEANVQQAQPEASGELRGSCAELLGEIEPIQDMDGSALNGEVIVASNASEREDCTDFAWIRGSITVATLIDPEWAEPALTLSAWDCCHSSLEYTVYRQVAGHWQYVTGALAFGLLSEEGVCRHSVENFPVFGGSDTAVVFPEAGAAATAIRVGVRAWSHNDPAMGHAGDECKTTSCYWPVALRWEMLPIATP